MVHENKPGRIDRLVELLDQTQGNGNLTKPQGQVIHVLKRYACGVFGVKFLHQICAEVSTLSGPLFTRAPSDVRSFCEYAARILPAAKPRKLNCGFEMKPLLLFSDGCWESGFAGIRAVMVDTAGRASFVCVGTAPKRLLELWKVQIGWYIICQSELYAMVLSRWQCQGILWDRRSICWANNDAVRYCTIRGLSPSKAMHSLVREFYLIDASAPTYNWGERVPSSSDISDGPPRRALSLLGLNSKTPLNLLASC